MRTLHFICISIAALLAMISCDNGSSSAKTETVADSTTTQTADNQIADTITISMNGDIMTGSIMPTRNMPPNDGKDIFVDCAPIIRSVDVACGNLEGVLADSGRMRKSPGPLSFSFMMPTKSVNLLVDAGYDFLGIANNHIFDFWEEGTQNTIKTVKEAGIGVAGTKDCETSIREIKGVKYGFCAFGHENYSLKTQDTATVKRVVQQLRKEADIVIVCFHGGAEGKNQCHLPHGTEFFNGMNRGDTRQFAHLCIDCGADIVFGHGPHVCRAMELYKGHLIAYSLGNFATPRGMNLSGVTGYAPLLVARIDKKGMFIDGKIHSFIQYHDKGPRHDSNNTVAKQIKQLSASDIVDNQLIFTDDGTITHK